MQLSGGSRQAFEAPDAVLATNCGCPFDRMDDLHTEIIPVVFDFNLNPNHLFAISLIIGRALPLHGQPIGAERMPLDADSSLGLYWSDSIGEENSIEELRWKRTPRTKRLLLEAI